jgi:hypothetical protein
MMLVIVQVVVISVRDALMEMQMGRPAYAATLKTCRRLIVSF